jgi:hypothetical protein
MWADCLEKREFLDVSQPCGLPRPVTGDRFRFFTMRMINIEVQKIYLLLE